MKKKILIAHHDKDLSWISEIDGNIDYVIYTTSSKEIKGVNSNKIFHLAKNKGMDANMYLNYILNNYSNLPDKILFVHHHIIDWSQDFSLPFIINNLKWEFSDYINIGCRNCYANLYEMENGKYEYVKNDWLRNIWFLFESYLEFPENTLYYYAGTQFMTNKELILKYPKTFYEKLLKWLMDTNWECQKTGRIFEYLWHYILTGKSDDVYYKNEEIFNL
jgi:hypothetical protein